MTSDADDARVLGAAQGARARDLTMAAGQLGFGVDAPAVAAMLSSLPHVVAAVRAS